MNKSMSVVVFAIAVLSASTALAQSSGNFDAAVSPTVCTLNSSPNASDTSCLVYDQRFQQISNTLFTNVATCAAGNAGTICTSDAACTGGTICGPADLLGTRTCTCGFDLTLSTLSAHSFNFVAQVPGD